MIKLISPFTLGRGIAEKANIAIVAIYAVQIVAAVPLMYFLLPHGALSSVINGKPFLLIWSILGIPLYLVFLYLSLYFLYFAFFSGFFSYRPSKTYWQIRIARKNAILYYRFLAIIGLIYIFDEIIYIYYGGRLFSMGSLVRVCNSLFLLMTAYYGLISLRVHTNLDHVSSLALKRAGVISERDRVYASYQSFDSSISQPTKAGEFIIGVLSDRIAVMQFSNNQWKSILIPFKEIAAIGILRYGGDIYIGIRSNNGQFIRITIDIVHLVSEPITFINGLLDQIDSSLNYNLASKRKRKVEETVTGAPLESKTMDENSSFSSAGNERVIELEHSFISRIGSAVPMENSRNLEL